jgi:hypothetical protein
MAECQDILGTGGAESVAVHYSDGEPAGLSFVLRTPHGGRAYTMPVDVEAMHALLLRESQAGRLSAHAGKSYRRTAAESREQAARVAWRVVKDWLEAQMALVAARQATLTDVMLPYLHVEGDRTLREVFNESENRALVAAEADRR